MKKFFISLFLFSFLCSWSQSDFNNRSHASIDIAYFPYQSTSFFSSELQLRRKKQYLFGGLTLSNWHRLADGPSWQYSLKIGYGIYPYKNLKRLKVHHRINYAYEWDIRDKDWRVHYLFLGNGVEYWILDKFTVSLGLNMGFGDKDEFQFQPLVTAKYIFKEK